MRLSLAVEPLEDRTLPSMLTGGEFYRFEPAPNREALLSAEHLADFLRFRIEAPGSPGHSPGALFDFSGHHLGFLSLLGAISALAGSDRLSNGLNSGWSEKESEGENLQTRNGLSSEPGALPGSLKQPLVSPGNLRSSTPLLADPADPTALGEMALAARLADAVFLGGLVGGVPPPQADLLPLANRHLAILAAYLVGQSKDLMIVGRIGNPTVAADFQSAGQLPADWKSAATDGLPIRPTTLEPGLTEFIVGVRHLRPESGTLPAGQGDSPVSSPTSQQMSPPVPAADSTHSLTPFAPSESWAGILERIAGVPNQRPGVRPRETEPGPTPPKGNSPPQAGSSAAPAPSEPESRGEELE